MSTQNSTEGQSSAAFADVVGCVLAGGLSRRMGGGDKSLIHIGGSPMLSRVLERLSPQVGHVIINANGDPNRFASYQCTVVRDPIDGFAGPLAGILAGLMWTRNHKPEATHVLTVAADTPFFPIDLVERFRNRSQQDSQAIVLAASDGKQHPVFGLWPVQLADDLHTWLAENQSRKVLHWVERHPNLSESFDGLDLNGARLDPFFNANTPEDIDLANTLAGAMAEKDNTA